MCGICGIVSFAALDASKVSNMLDKLQHRGPQGSHSSCSFNACFGAQRLAIRGLSDGKQPFIDPETGVMVVCNGEIDNHQALRDFLNQKGRPVLQATDIAVIPNLYLELGESFVEKLEGAFALAIFDPRNHTLILARDRAGERFLFYTIDETGITFATEIAALCEGLGSSPKVDATSIQYYLQHGYFPAPYSPFNEIKKVKPAQMLIFQNTSVRSHQYWQWPMTTLAKKTPSITQFDAIFRKAVAQQSDIDVDFGIFLSGGLDSSLVASVMRSLYPKRHLRAYTLRFSEKSYDEGYFAQKVADQLQLDLKSLLITPDAFVQELPKLIHQVGEPLADPAWIPTVLLSQCATKEVRLAFSGEGADELFGGYPTYIGGAFAKYYHFLPSILRKPFERFIQWLPQNDKKMPLSFLLKRFVEAVNLDPCLRHQVWTSNIQPPLLAKLTKQAKALSPIFSLTAKTSSLLDYCQQYDFEMSLAEGLLTKVDRGSMSASLEVRAPFLDQAVMEFAASLPEKSRVKGYATKVFLKQYAEQYIDHSIIYRRKNGLSIPLSHWLRGPLYQWAKTQLNSGLLDTVGLDNEAINVLLQEHMQRKANHARPLWALLVLQEWLVFTNSL